MFFLYVCWTKCLNQRDRYYKTKQREKKTFGFSSIVWYCAQFTRFSAILSNWGQLLKLSLHRNGNFFFVEWLRRASIFILYDDMFHLFGQDSRRARWRRARWDTGTWSTSRPTTRNNKLLTKHGQTVHRLLSKKERARQISRQRDKKYKNLTSNNSNRTKVIKTTTIL